MELYFRYDCDQSIDEVCNSKDDGNFQGTFLKPYIEGKASTFNSYI